MLVDLNKQNPGRLQKSTGGGYGGQRPLSRAVSTARPIKPLQRNGATPRKRKTQWVLLH